MAEQAQAAAEQKAEPGASPAPGNGKGEGKPEAEPKGAKAEPEVVPLSAHIEAQKQLKAALKRVAEYEAKDKEAADKAALERGEGAKFAQERDREKARADGLAATMQKLIDATAKTLDDEGKEFLALIAEDDLPRRFEAVLKLSNKKQPAPGLGTKGGGAVEAKAGLIPAAITTRTQYTDWLRSISTMRATKEERALLTDRKLSEQLAAEAKEKGLA